MPEARGHSEELVASTSTSTTFPTVPGARSYNEALAASTSVSTTIPTVQGQEAMMGK